MKYLIRKEMIFVLLLLILSGCAGSKCVHKKSSIEPAVNNELVKASEQGNLTEVKRLLENGTNIKAVNDTGWTSLNMAVYNGHIEIVKYLIEKGADVNDIDRNDWTPLKIAESQNNIKMINFLKEKGAKKK